ncbi:MBL fold metallo-hydrolase [Ramlibacter sp. AN1015]|uniref:MBL fold metallo-hydrolase n=1 Tax=Ramlibacter sp. AN1015 TaxID=3133428 RepID=UPI0030BEB3D0
MYNAISNPIQAPERGRFTLVAQGVWWIRLALPFRLDHINVWAIEDEEGWTLVDTGIRGEETVRAWERLLGSPPFDRNLSRVIVTHMHPDHVGMAGWLCRRFGAALWISALEYLSCRALVSDSSRQAPDEAIAFYREAGWDANALEAYRARFGRFGNHVYALPDSYRRMKDGQSIRIGRHSWTVVTGSGHSPEHSCLYCEELKLFISGDQVLPRISSNVSVYPIEPNADPMADWLASLERIRMRVPGDVLVLPAHNECFHGLHVRVRNLLEGQEQVLNRLREALQSPKRVIDVFSALFRHPVQPSDSQMLGLATGEALANLNLLLGRGEVAKELVDGVAWYRMK